VWLSVSFVLTGLVNLLTRDPPSMQFETALLHVLEFDTVALSTNNYLFPLKKRVEYSTPNIIFRVVQKIQLESNILTQLRRHLLIRHKLNITFHKYNTS